MQSDSELVILQKQWNEDWLKKAMIKKPFEENQLQSQMPPVSKISSKRHKFCQG